MTKPAANNAPLNAQQRQHLQQQSEKIIIIANEQTGSALKCIHLLKVNGGATEATYKAIERRILADQDPEGAYHLALLAQTTADLPIDARQLIELVIEQGNNQQRLALLNHLPLPAVDEIVATIKAKIIASGDKVAIDKLQDYI